MAGIQLKQSDTTVASQEQLWPVRNDCGQSELEFLAKK